MLSVADSRELQAAVLAVRAADRSLRSEISRQTRAALTPVWREEVAAALTTRDPLATRVLGTGVRVAAGNPPSALAATSTRKIGRTKRLQPAVDWHLWEFGTNRAHQAKYQRKNRTNPGSHQVTRHTNRGLPAKNKAGISIFPAMSQAAPRMVSLWVQVVVRAYAKALNGQ